MKFTITLDKEELQLIRHAMLKTNFNDEYFNDIFTKKQDKDLVQKHIDTWGKINTLLLEDKE